MRRPVLRYVLILAVLIGIVAACGGGTASPGLTTGAVGMSPGPVAPTSEASAPATSPPPTVTPGASLAGGEPCAIEPASSPDEACEMPAGDYRSTQFGPGVAFELVGDGWLNASNESDLLSFFNMSAEWISFMSGEPGSPDGALSDLRTARAYLESLDGLRITEGDRVTIDGVRATVIDAANRGSDHLFMWTSPVRDEAYILTPDTTVRIYWMMIGDSPLVLALEVPTPGLDSFLAEQQAFIDSIDWSNL